MDLQIHYVKKTYLPHYNFSQYIKLKFACIIMLRLFYISPQDKDIFIQTFNLCLAESCD